MLGDISGLENIYIVCGYTDMRKSFYGLWAIIEDQLKMALHRPVLSSFSVEKTGQDPSFVPGNVIRTFSLFPHLYKGFLKICADKTNYLKPQMRAISSSSSGHS
ncbi:hypothetical protein K040078D81_44160 [Blautia hominis]|uniref:Uncharacterized protein n=1 Tax=Blautia hominis TaxID=2025493 RepID=A0ABQ0BFU4_9FIRM